MAEFVEVIYERELFDKTFRVYGSVENPLFLAKEVAEWIDYSKSGNGSYNITQMLNSVDEDEKVFASTKNVSREVWFLTEDGLYEVLMQSRKPVAKQFKKKVKEILKEIRKTGRYVASSSCTTNNEQIPDFNNLLDVMESWIATKRENIQLKQDLLECQQEYQRSVDLSNNSYTSSNIDVSAFVYVVSTDNFKISRNQIYQWLRDHEYVYRSNGSHLPYPQYVEEGLFEVIEYPCVIAYRLQSVKKLMITPKGQTYFANAIRQDYFENGGKKTVTIHSLDNL